MIYPAALGSVIVVCSQFQYWLFRRYVLYRCDLRGFCLYRLNFKPEIQLKAMKYIYIYTQKLLKNTFLSGSLHWDELSLATQTCFMEERGSSWVGRDREMSLHTSWRQGGCRPSDSVCGCGFAQLCVLKYNGIGKENRLGTVCARGTAYCSLAC